MMQPQIDPAIRAKIRQNTIDKLEKMGSQEKIQLAAVSALKIAMMAVDPNEDRSLQTDIGRESFLLAKCSAMMKMVEMVREAFDEGDKNPKMMVSNVAELMVVVIDACKDESVASVRRLQNLVDLYKELHPDVDTRLNQEAEDNWKVKHGDNG